MIELFTDRGGPIGETPLVILHGFTGSGRAMSSVVEPLRRTRDVITVDLLGHGQSPSPESVDSYAMAAVVEQVVAVVGAEPVDLFGYSMGGRVALSIAIAHRQRIRRLAVLGGSPGIIDAAERAERHRRDQALADSIAGDGLAAFVDRWMALPMFASLSTLGGDWLESSRKQRLSSDAVGLANSLRGTGTGAMPPLHQDLANLELPVLVMAGSSDEKYLAIGRSMVAGLTNGLMREIADAGHAAHLESPAICVKELAEFLDGR
ncbi:MAG: 2-succinyl-6-hydroxy-2,4-cyclohexadiene-1-carboxylate synthase [Acidimicrobiales bacterium]